jgi:hypothetical protein
MKSNLQRLYVINLYAAIVISGIMALYLALYLLSVIQVDSEIGLLAIFIIVVFFLPFNLFLKSQNKKFGLKIPNFIPQLLPKFLPTVSFIICMAVMVYGITTYPHAPVKAEGSLFTDKAGNTYSSVEFRNFKKWETTYIITWSFVALQSIVFLPFFDRKSRKWRF